MLVEGLVENQFPKAFTLFLGHLKFFLQGVFLVYPYTFLFKLLQFSYC